jgi:hypothetical protein
MQNRHIRTPVSTRKSLIALLVLALLAVWTGGPALTAPCAMDAASMTASMPSSDGPCKPDTASCQAEMACCQALPSVPTLPGSAWQSADWRQARYFSAAKPLTGLRPKPELHPPTMILG